MGEPGQRFASGPPANTLSSCSTGDAVPWLTIGVHSIVGSRRVKSSHSSLGRRKRMMIRQRVRGWLGEFRTPVDPIAFRTAFPL